MRTLLALAAFALAVAPAHAAPATTLTLLAISDWHGTAEHGIWGGLDENDESEASREWAWQIPGGERLGCAIAAEKARDPDTVLVAAGDMITDATTRPVYGAGSWPAVEAMNRMGIRWSAFGNHEANEGPDVWNRWAARLNTRYLAANAPGTWVGQASAKHPVYGAGVAIETVKGIRVAYVGVMVQAPVGGAAYYGAGDQLEGKIADPQATANRLARRIKNDGAADVVVVLAHVGLRAETYPEDWQDETYMPDAGWVPEVDVVVGGHTHRTFKAVQGGGRQALVEPSAFGRVLGRVEVKVSGGKVESVAVRYVKTEDTCGADQYGLAGLEGRVGAARSRLGASGADYAALGAARVAALRSGLWEGPAAAQTPTPTQAQARAGSFESVVAPLLARQATRADTGRPVQTIRAGTASPDTRAREPEEERQATAATPQDTAETPQATPGVAPQAETAPRARPWGHDPDATPALPQSRWKPATVPLPADAAPATEEPRPAPQATTPALPLVPVLVLVSAGLVGVAAIARIRQP